METSASFEARYAPWFYPAGMGDHPGHPVALGNRCPYRDRQLTSPDVVSLCNQEGNDNRCDS